MSKHTPGPWIVGGHGQVVAPGKLVVNMTINGGTYEETKANARLIAAATAMLELLEKILTEDVLLVRVCSPEGIRRDDLHREITDVVWRVNNGTCADCGSPLNDSVDNVESGRCRACDFDEYKRDVIATSRS